MATRERDQYRNATSSARDRGRRLTGLYDERAEDYDPYEDAERASMATGRRLYEDFGRDLGDLRGSLVGSGRLRTGYGAQDEDRLYDRFQDRLSNTLAQNSMRASAMDLQHTQGMGRMGSQSQGRYLDLLTGEMDRQQAERNARRQQQSSLWGTVGGIAGGALGTLLGPAGTAVGGAIGKKVGGWVGG